MMRVAAASLLAGCAMLHVPALPVGPPPPPSDTAEVGRGDELARGGSPRGARDVYESVLRDHPDEETAARALYGLALLYVDPESALHDARRARTTFDRLATRYPKTPQAREARAWRALLDDVEQQTLDAERARDELERLKALDMELERAR